MNNQKNTVITDDEQVIDLGLLLKDFFRALKKLWCLVLILVVAGAVGWYVYTYARYTPIYESQATVTVATGSDESTSYGFTYSQGTADQISKTFPYILESGYFKSVLLEKLESKTLNGTIEAETVEDSNIVTIRVKSPVAEDSLKILEAALEVYPETARFVLGEIRFNMLEEPKLPNAPSNRPVRWKVLAKGGMAGAAVGFLVLFIVAYFRRTVRTPDEIKQLTSMKCLAAVPYVKTKARKNKVQQKISVLDPRISFGFKESIRALQIRLEREMKKNEGKVLLITSTEAGEGKSVLAMNLAEMLASGGKEVLLIDADLRKPEGTQLPDGAEGFGIQNIVKADPESRMDELVCRLDESAIWYAGGDRKVSRPAALLSHPAFSSFLRKMRRSVDYIIMDAPPCGTFQDAAILGEQADTVLYVIKYDTVSRQKIQQGLTFLGDGRTPVAGYVLNAYPENVNDYGYGHYGYGHYGYGKYGYGKYGYETVKQPDRE